MLGLVRHTQITDWRISRQPAPAAVCMPTHKPPKLESGIAERFDSRYNTGGQRAEEGARD